MSYVITRPRPRTKKMTLEDILFDLIDETQLNQYSEKNFTTGTRTTWVESIGNKWLRQIDIQSYIKALEDFYSHNAKMDIFFNENYNYETQIKIRKQVERESMKNNENLTEETIIQQTKDKLKQKGLEYNPFYYTFYLPKRSGKGFRQIDAPEPELKIAQSQLKTLFESMMNYNTYHTSAYAYIPKRSRVDLVKKMQTNKVRWTLHTDFSDFFGSIDIEFTMRQLEKIFPFSEIVKSDRGRAALYNALKFCYLDGRLPQGTPISPLLTNIIMIPIDYKISNILLDAEQITEFDNAKPDENFRLIYTRYADDIFIGGHRGFKYRPVIDCMRQIIKEENAPLKIKDEKTKYKSINGENWILGLMYNQSQNITVGRKRKKQTQAIIANFAMDFINKTNQWDVNDIQVAMGNISYIGQIEPDYCASMLERANKKFGIDILATMKELAYGN